MANLLDLTVGSSPQILILIMPKKVSMDTELNEHNNNPLASRLLGQ